MSRFGRGEWTALAKADPGVHELSDVDVQRISIVDKGANRKRFFMRKREGEDDAVDVRLFAEPIAKADWSAVYCVVAEPGALEDPGMHGDQAIPDRWTSEDEIRKACHRFAKNGGAINRMHESLDPFGTLVENAIAPVDFSVIDPDGEPHLIKCGSWYIAIEPNEEGRSAIEDGTFTGVSIEGGGVRKLVAKGGANADHAALDDLLVGEDGKLTKAALGLAKASGAALPGLDRKPGKSNWVDEVGGLPSLIDRAARHLHTERGRTISAAIATAVNWAKKMCATGTAFGGKTKVSAKAQAAACNAVKQWEAKKAQAHVTKARVAKGDSRYQWETTATVDDYLMKRKKTTVTTSAGSRGGSSSGRGSVAPKPPKSTPPASGHGHGSSGTVTGQSKPGASPMKLVQRALRSAGHKPGRTDGWHGPKTNKAVKGFQKANKLKADGVVGRKTKGALKRTTGMKITGKVPGFTSAKPGRFNRRHEHGRLKPKFRKLGKALGIVKGQPTFAARMAERDLDEELPDAMSVLRSVIWSAFYPPVGDDAKDPREIIETSLDEFKAWALDLLGRVPAGEIAKSLEAAEAQTGDSATVENMLTDEERDLLNKLAEASEEQAEALTDLPDAIAKAIADNGEGEGGDGEDGDEPTDSDRIDKLSTAVEELTGLVKAFGAGAQSGGNGSGDPAAIAKSGESAHRGIL